MVGSSFAEKVLGILIDKKLNMSQQPTFMQAVCSHGLHQQASRQQVKESDCSSLWHLRNCTWIPRPVLVTQYKTDIDIWGKSS